MSKGGVIAGAALAVAIGAGAGGYVYIQSKAGTLVDTLIANAAQVSGIESLSYGTKNVDLFADTITLSDLKAVANLGELFSPMVQKGMTITGTAPTTFETVTISGVWDIVLGGTEIASIDAINGTSTADMVQTMENATVSTPSAAGTVSQKVEKATVKMKSSSTIPHLNVQGLNFASLLESNDQTTAMENVSIASYDSENIKMKLELSIEQSGPNARPVPGMSFNYDIGRIHGENISLAYIGLATTQNTTITVPPPKPGMPEIKMNIGEVSVSDTKLVDMFPVQSTYAVKDMVVELPDQIDPEMAMVMAMLGVEELNFDMNVHYAWNESDKSFELAPFKFGLKKVGAIDVSLNMFSLPSLDELMALKDEELAALTPSTEENGQPSPEELKAQVEKNKAALDALFADAALKRVAVGYKDEGALKTFIAMQALQVGGDVNILAQGISRQAAMIVSATHGADKAQEVRDKLVAFITNPTELRIGLSSSTPVKFTDLKKDIDANGPMALRKFQLDVIGGN